MNYEENKKTDDHIVLLAKTKLNTIKFLIPKTLSDSYTNQDKNLFQPIVC